MVEDEVEEPASPDKYFSHLPRLNFNTLIDGLMDVCFVVIGGDGGGIYLLWYCIYRY